MRSLYTTILPGGQIIDVSVGLTWGFDTPENQLTLWPVLTINQALDSSGRWEMWALALDAAIWRLVVSLTQREQQ